MKVEEIKEKIQLALQAVADVEEPFKIKAFEVILSTLLKKPEAEGRVAPLLHQLKLLLRGQRLLTRKLQNLQMRLTLK